MKRQKNLGTRFGNGVDSMVDRYVVELVRSMDKEQVHDARPKTRLLFLMVQENSAFS